MIFAVFDPSPLTAVYKLQFFTFIFAVLLPGLSRLLIMSMVIHFRFFKMAAVCHLRFLNLRIETGLRTFVNSTHGSGGQYKLQFFYIYCTNSGALIKCTCRLQ